MRTKSLLVHFAYYFAGIAFWGGCFSLLCLLLFRFTSIDFHIGSFRVSSQYAKGYTIPVKLSVQQVPDTIIFYHKKSGSGQINIYSDEKSRYLPSAFDSIKKAVLADDSAQKSLVVAKWVALPVYNDEVAVRSISGKDVYEILEKQVAQSPVTPHVPAISTTVEVQVTGKTKWQNFMLSIHGYLGFFVYLFICFHIMKLLQSWRWQMSFLDNLHKRVKLVGKVLIYSQVIYFLFVFVYRKYFGAIILETAMPEQYASKGFGGIQVQFNPTSGASFTVFSIGIGLIILSMLFKHGQHIEKEAALTV
jgi:hypothetical protein